MDDHSGARSVKIDQDERGGWSSDRPRPGGDKRLADLSTKGRALAPAEQLVYTPPSLLVIVSASAEARDSLVTRVVGDRSAVFSLDKIRGLLEQKLDPEVAEAKAPQLLEAAVAKRFDSGVPVVLPLEGVTAEERERWVRKAAALRRPCHLLLVEAGRGEEVSEEDAAALGALRQAIDKGTLGSEGFSTFVRLGGPAITELKRILFRNREKED